jgi:type I restriction enzyme S subunit
MSHSYPLRPLAEVIGNGLVSDGDWIESKDQDANGDVRLIQLADIGDGRYLNKSNRFLTKETASRLKCTPLLAGDVLIARMPDPIGRACIFPGDAKEAITVVDVCILRVDQRATDAAWLMNVINADFTRNAIEKAAGGTTRTRVSRGSLEKLLLPTPALQEQHKIAAILTAVDDKLDVIARQIEATQTLKQGLMQTLFTRGVGTQDAGGRWVPHTEFKDSEKGEIPATWEVRSLNDVVDNLDRQRVPLKQADRAQRQGMVPYYGASGVIDWIDDFIFDGDFILLGEDGENVLSRKLPLAFRATGKIWVNNHAHVFRPKVGYDIQFLVELLESLDYSTLASGTAQPKITQQALNQLRFAVPPLDEQVRIGSLLETVAEKIASLRLKHKRNSALKRGLMQKLLTGEWRVKVDSDMAA